MGSWFLQLQWSLIKIMDQSKQVGETSITEADLSDGRQDTGRSNLSTANGKSRMDLSVQGSTLEAIMKGTVCFNDLVRLAQVEFEMDNTHAVKQVLAMINLWQSLRSVGKIKDKNSDGTQVLSSLANQDIVDHARPSSLHGNLESPLKELKQLKDMQNSLDAGSRSVSLDEQLWLLTHSGNLGEITTKGISNKTVIMSPAVSTASVSHLALTGDKENDGGQISNDNNSMMNRDEELEYLGNAGDITNIMDNDDNFKNINKVTLPVESMSVGQRISREVILRELGPKECRLGMIDCWDPLACTLDNDSKNRMVKEIEQDQDIVPVAGLLTPPIRGKGQAMFNRDNALVKILEDVNTMVRGSAQAMALTLDNRGDEAVRRSAKVLVLGANVMSRVNAERMRIHYPREFANKVLKPLTEPIVREVHRERAKYLAQDIKNQNVLMNTLFRKGGRGTKEGGKAKMWRTNRFSFPRNSAQSKFRKFNNQKFRRSHNQSGRQQVPNPSNQ
jgi:hypothetical protein